MNRQTLADVLQSTNQTGSYTLATVLEGAEAGSQLLLRDGDALWQTQSAELLQRQLSFMVLSRWIGCRPEPQTKKHPPNSKSPWRV